MKPNGCVPNQDHVIGRRDGLLISENQLTVRGIRGLVSRTKPVGSRPFSPYPKGRCNSTQCCQLNHTRRRQNPASLVDCEGIE